MKLEKFKKIFPKNVFGRCIFEFLNKVFENKPKNYEQGTHKYSSWFRKYVKY